MDKSKLEETYESVTKIIDKLNYLLFVIKYIIDNVDENEKDENELNIMYIDLITILNSYSYDKQKIIQLENKVNNLFNEYNIDIDSLNIDSYIQNIQNRIIDNIKN